MLDDYFGSFGSYCRYFKKIGHAAELFIGNDTRLQKKWLRSRGIRDDSLSKHEVVLRQIEELRPDVFFIGSMFDYYGEFLKKVSKVTKNIFAWIACPYPDDLDYTHIRCIISSADNYVERFRSLGLRAELLRAAFDADILRWLDNRKKIDVFFVGGLSRVTHRRRVEGLEYILSKGIELKTFGYAIEKSCIPFFRSALERSYKGELWGMDMYKALNHSKISLNFHIDVWNKAGANMRTFEVTGCGALLLTEKSPDIEEYFEPGKEIDVYDSPEELTDKISYYLSHEADLQSVAEAGQRACIDRHGYDKRILEFEKILNEHAV